MGKYSGIIGYGISENKTPGVYTQTITEREIFGDVIKITRRLDKNENLNDNINVLIKISFLADPYDVQNFLLIKYVSYLGTLWKVATVEEEYPRLILTLGGVYNDEREQA